MQQRDAAFFASIDHIDGKKLAEGGRRKKHYEEGGEKRGSARMRPDDHVTRHHAAGSEINQSISLYHLQPAAWRAGFRPRRRLRKRSPSVDHHYRSISASTTHLSKNRRSKSRRRTSDRSPVDHNMMTNNQSTQRVKSTGGPTTARRGDLTADKESLSFPLSDSLFQPGLGSSNTTAATAISCPNQETNDPPPTAWGRIRAKQNPLKTLPQTKQNLFYVYVRVRVYT